MTETVCLVMPAAALAAPTPSRTGRRGVSGAQETRGAATSLALSEMRLREVEARARERADPSNEAIVARARELMAGSGGTLNAIEAVHRARAEAGLARPRGPNDADIVAGARRLMAESGGTMNVIAAVHRVRPPPRKTPPAGQTRLAGGLRASSGLDATQAVTLVRDAG